MKERNKTVFSKMAAATLIFATLVIPISALLEPRDNSGRRVMDVDPEENFRSRSAIDGASEDLGGRAERGDFRQNSPKNSDPHGVRQQQQHGGYLRAEDRTDDDDREDRTNYRESYSSDRYYGSYSAYRDQPLICIPSAPRQSSRRGIDEGCEWTTVFKAVANNGRNTLQDFLSGGNMNEGNLQARNISSDLVYRDSSILDNWDHLVIEQVRTEIFSEGERKTWMLYNGLGSTLTSWIAREREIASPFPVFGLFEDLSLEGGLLHELIGRGSNFLVVAADEDCFFMGVFDVVPEDSAFTEIVVPEFWYTTSALCTDFDGIDSVAFGDRFVISVKLCDVDL